MHFNLIIIIVAYSMDPFVAATVMIGYCEIWNLFETINKEINK